MDSVIQVLAEPPLPHHLFQVLIRRADQPKIHLDLFFAAQPRQRPVLQHAQQLALQRRRERRNLVKEQRPLVRQLDAPFLRRHRSRKRALLVPEKLRLHQPFRQRRAIHAHESAVSPRALLVQRPRHQLFSHAALAANDHVRRGARHPLDRVEHVPHRVGGADQIAERVLPADFLPQQPVLALDVQFFNGALEQVPQHVRIDRLDEIIV